MSVAVTERERERERERETERQRNRSIECALVRWTHLGRILSSIALHCAAMAPPVTGSLSSSIVLVSSYTDNDILAHVPNGGKGTGITSFGLDTATGQLLPLSTLAVGPNVAFLLKHPRRDIVYATTECINANGQILTLLLAPDGSLTVIDQRNARGRSTCYINIDDDCRVLTVVNYWDATIATFALSDAGLITGECDLESMPGAEYVAEANPDRVEHWQYRQRWPHTHCAKREPYGRRRLFVCDLGRDKVLHYVTAGGMLRCTGDIQMDKGIGPRHIEFHPRLRMAYVTNELTSTVSVCVFSAERETALEQGGPVCDDVHAETALLWEVRPDPRSATGHCGPMVGRPLPSRGGG